MTLVEANEILSAFDSKLRSYTERLMKKRKAMHIAKAAVTGICILCVRTYVCVCVFDSVVCVCVLYGRGDR